MSPSTLTAPPDPEVREAFRHRLRQIHNHGALALAISLGHRLGLFDVTVCGGDTFRRKPNPEPIFKALELLAEPPTPTCWYLGDSSTDVVCARRAEVTPVFFNGAGWEHAWLEKVFPGTPAHPHKPDAIVDSFREFRWLFEECLSIEHRA